MGLPRIEQDHLSGRKRHFFARRVDQKRIFKDKQDLPLRVKVGCSVINRVEEHAQTVCLGIPNDFKFMHRRSHLLSFRFHSRLNRADHS